MPIAKQIGRILRAQNISFGPAGRKITDSTVYSIIRAMLIFPLAGQFADHLEEEAVAVTKARLNEKRAPKTPYTNVFRRAERQRNFIAAVRQIGGIIDPQTLANLIMNNQGSIDDLISMYRQQIQDRFPGIVNDVETLITNNIH